MYRKRKKRCSEGEDIIVNLEWEGEKTGENFGSPARMRASASFLCT
jgi:hypothetical protein